MRILYFALALISVSALSNQCKHPKYTADNLPDEHLRFGNGGGFTGVETTFTLLENGQLFKSTSAMPQAVALKNCNRKTADNLLDTAEDLGLLKLDFDHPGNIYKFIEFTDDGQTRRITWGDPAHPVDEKIKGLYEQLVQLTSNQ
ncbi:MAG: hypothetical protein IPM98_17025 [Lewinellaceae bacterium]|nr:hypothetical protein [Lewinellaceae bacterium]